MDFTENYYFLKNLNIYLLRNSIYLDKEKIEYDNMIFVRD
jgi:hypothetical protein